jgi:hypothetical protein
MDYVWYVGYKILPNGNAEIFLHDRLRLGLAMHKHPETEDEFRFTESPDRVALALEINGVRTQIENAKHVFSYPKF